MLHLSGSELLFWGGIVVMAEALGLGAICGAVLFVSGRKLKRKLEKEYGKTQS